jgi:hypothetical protein
MPPGDSTLEDGRCWYDCERLATPHGRHLAAADLMATTEKQKQDWESRFEGLGESEVRADLQKSRGVYIVISNDDMLQVALAWLRDKERARGNAS